MDIIIKSFNRPYYLDRCLYSIKKYARGDFKIIIIDDGTPERYLEKIKEKYPDIVIKKTTLADKKSKYFKNIFDKNNSKVIGFPAKDWIKTVEESSSEYIFVTEDDVWLTQEIDFNKYIEEMHYYNISLLKISWQGISSKGLSVENPLTKNILQILPIKMITPSKKMIHNIFFNKWKIKSILHRLGIIDATLFKKYYLLISISMGIYKKEYWLKTWENIDGDYMELNQLSNVGSKYNKNTIIARSNEEFLKTTYISSATMHDHKTSSDFDIDYFNFILNEEWYNFQLDPYNNFPNDFSEKYIENFLEKYNYKEASVIDWRYWRNDFKQYFINAGAKVNTNI